MLCWQGRVALVTGASYGIGAEIAETLVKNGLTVVGCARSVEIIQKLGEKLKEEKGRLIPIKCDLTKEDEILSMFDQIQNDYGGVDICINNAGLFDKQDTLLYGETAVWKNIIDLNVIALSICTREAIKSMMSRGIDDGQIIHIGSYFGHSVPNICHMYTASKFAVRALCEGLRRELRDIKSHIRVAEISCGSVTSPSLTKLVGEDYPYKMETRDIAEAVIYILSAPAHVQIHDVLIRPIHEIV